MVRLIFQNFRNTSAKEEIKGKNVFQPILNEQDITVYILCII